MRYLRKGARREMAAALEVIQVELTQDVIDPSIYARALARYDETRALLDIIGLNSTGRDGDSELEARWRSLIVKLLKTQHSVEVSRLDDAAAQGLQLAPGDIPVLGELLSELSDQLKSPSRHHRGGLLRRCKRQRGDA